MNVELTVREADPTGDGRVADATIVVPQFEQAELTRDCIRSLRAHESKLWPIVLVDDGSTSAWHEMLADVPLDGLQVVEQPHRGVTAAWNFGARLASTDYLVFLNNDTMVDGPIVDRLVGPLCEDAAVVTGCELRHEARLPRSVAARLPSVEFLSGWCFAVSARLFEQVGGFDETLELYWSDTDFQSRLLRHCGVGVEKLACLSDLPIRHLWHRTAHTLNDHREQWRRDRARFFRKWSRMC